MSNIKFKEYNQCQLQLLPQDLESKIVPDHLARLISETVDNLDLSAIEQTYSDQGQHAYSPKMLLKVLIYGYSAGIQSSRKLADRIKEDIVFMWLSGRNTPDFRTISDFRKDRLNDFKNIFEQVLKTCFALNMVRVGKVSLDGTKILANASKNKAIFKTNLKKQQDLIKQKVDQLIKEAEAIDEEEERLYGNATPHQLDKVFTKEQITKAVKKVQNQRKQLERKRTILKVKSSEIKKKERIMRKDRNSFSLIDKDSTVMMMKEGYTAPGYNVQLATERQVILAYGISSNRTDQKLLKPMIEELKENTGQVPETLITDAGYGRKINYRYLKNKSIQSYIPYNTYDQDRILRSKGLYQYPKNPDTELEKYKFTQRLRLQSEEGKEMMARRRQDVEPVIGNIKRNMGFRRFNLRGKKKCEVELGLVSLTHNLKKIKNHIKKMIGWGDQRRQVLELGTVLGYLPA